MAGYRKKNADGPNSEDKALDLFAEMMIEKSRAFKRTGKALVYGGYATVAPQPSRARVQRDECFYAAFALRERRVQDSPFLHVRLCSEAQ